MAIFSIDHHEDGSIIAIWKLEETEEELLSQCILPTNEKEELQYIKNPQRRLERLAIRVLLNRIAGEKSYLGYHDNGRPFLQNSTVNISITHTDQFVAVIYNPSLDVGIDIESLSRNVDVVAHKALSEGERRYLSEKHRLAQLCLIWCAKEAMYKRISENGIDFARQFFVEKFTPKKKGKLTVIYTDNDNIKEEFIVNYKVIDNHALVWVAM
jgi:phosphopantetheinyl transferase